MNKVYYRVVSQPSTEEQGKILRAYLISTDNDLIDTDLIYLPRRDEDKCGGCIVLCKYIGRHKSKDLYEEIDDKSYFNLTPGFERLASGHKLKHALDTLQYIKDVSSCLLEGIEDM